MPLPINRFVKKLIENKKLRFFIAKLAVISFLVVFSVSLPLFFLEENNPWIALFKALVLSFFSFAVGMFSAIAGELFKGEGKEG